MGLYFVFIEHFFISVLMLSGKESLLDLKAQ